MVPSFLPLLAKETSQSALLLVGVIQVSSKDESSIKAPFEPMGTGALSLVPELLRKVFNEIRHCCNGWSFAKK